MARTIECRTEASGFGDDKSQYPSDEPDIKTINEWFEDKSDDYKSELLMKMSTTRLAELAEGLFQACIDRTSEVGDKVYRIAQADYLELVAAEDAEVIRD